MPSLLDLCQACGVAPAFSDHFHHLSLNIFENRFLLFDILHICALLMYMNSVLLPRVYLRYWSSLSHGRFSDTPLPIALCEHVSTEPSHLHHSERTCFFHYIHEGVRLDDFLIDTAPTLFSRCICGLSWKKAGIILEHDPDRLCLLYL
ncbi:hypothetical protein AUEXF2481DRAFT_226826 [Aureobasidium subglaciale EXF-2481]|uniref:Uncharacterized protein n=1 Tax=Aureobasidium subglaciale (strain EXF-2481) TaxID=1043005 RepID=A0A074Z7Q1_AURSE|nr:uncharacterized protein AUEXF2481DRAFT_226826 [Aureobasidium subglaciale EXF-2481]KEQ94911.1 hypothetical protein AUEXF2481DRAFT_226826 [Aureobasidium subglaciale EXF-2481]